MSVWRRFGISDTGAALGGGMILLLLVGGYFVISNQPVPEQGAEPAAAVGTVTEEQAPASAVVDAEAEPAVVEEAPIPAGPRFDVVRIEPNGSAVIAGFAEPGSKIRLGVSGVPVAEAVADGNGNFVALFELPPSDAPRQLEAISIDADGVETPSDGAVLIAAGTVKAPEPAIEVAEVESEEGASETAPAEPVEQAEEKAAQEQPAAETEVATATPEPEAVQDEVAVNETSVEEEGATAEVVQDADPEVEVAAAPASETQPEGGEVAAATQQSAAATNDKPAVVVADSSGVRVLQPATQPRAPAEGPQVTTNVVIDTITYDTEGEVALSGRGQGTSFVRVYLNEKPIKTTSIGADGNWRAELPEVDAGVYRLRVDEVDAEGEVTSRVETPFKREEPEVVEGTISAITVQPGFTLWGIAKQQFGDGVQFVRVYEANRDLIRDPNLIYPGQVFTLPE